MALKVKETLIARVKNSDFFFSLELDKSTDIISNYAQLMAYVRYIFKTKIKKDYLFYDTLIVYTNYCWRNIKNVLSLFWRKFLNWKQCVGFCSDGARAMTGKHGGVATKIKLITENCTLIHCSIHREAFVVKRTPEQFKLILQETIKVVNFNTFRGHTISFILKIVF
jgi:hypothetical protein